MQFNRILKILPLVLALALIFTSCTEKIDIALDDTYTRLVVEGSITDQAGPHTVKLSLSGSYYENSLPRMVEDAQLRISDGTNIFLLSEVAPGIYQTDPEVQGVAGRTYTLDIENVMIDGELQSYTSSCYLPHIGAVDSINVLFNPDWEIWEVNLYALDPPSREYYLFKVYRNNELLTDTIDEFIVTDDNFFNGNYTFGIMVQWIKESNAKAGDSITAEMSSITEGYANFIWDVQQETGFSTPLFSGPPANIRGNISNGAIGYFAAYSLVRTSTLIE